MAAAPADDIAARCARARAAVGALLSFAAIPSEDVVPAVATVPQAHAAAARAALWDAAVRHHAHAAASELHELLLLSAQLRRVAHSRSVA